MAIKITHNQLRQIIKEEISLIEGQEGVDPDFSPSREEVTAIVDDLNTPAKERSAKIEYFLRRFIEDPSGTAQYISLGRKAADYGESAIDWLNKNVLSGGNFGLKNPTPKLP